MWCHVKGYSHSTSLPVLSQESLGLVDIVAWSTLYTVLAEEAPHSAGEWEEGVVSAWLREGRVMPM